MNAIDRQLEALETALTPRERAQAILRDWASADGGPDGRLMEFCPPADLPEVERIVRAVQDATSGLHSRLGLSFEWLDHQRTEVHWLRSLLLFKGRRLAPDGAPWSFERVAPRVFSASLPVGEDPPKTWEEVPGYLGRHLGRILRYRWATLLAMEQTFQEISDAVGVECLHHVFAEHLDAFAAEIETLRDLVCDAGFPFELPDEPGDTIELHRSEVRWDDIREKRAEPRKRWLPENRREEIEGLERGHAEQLRNRS